MVGNWIGLYTFIRREVERMFRVVVQTLVTPWISALLFIFIFGYVVGNRIDMIGGVPYIEFVLPGILMMNVITSAFAHTSSSIYFQRFTRGIEEILTAPLSHFEMIIGYVAGGVLRALIVAAGILGIGLIFGATGVANIWEFVFYICSVSVIFSLLGILVGLWANGFEQLNVLNTFVIMPFSFLGGVFYTSDMLPEHIRWILTYNPFFYFIDGIRHSMIGIRETDALLGAGVVIFLMAVFGLLVGYLFKIGWRLRS